MSSEGFRRHAGNVLDRICTALSRHRDGDRDAAARSEIKVGAPEVKAGHGWLAPAGRSIRIDPAL